MTSSRRNMKSAICYLMLTCLCLVSPCLFAQQTAQTSIAISPTAHYFNYTEFDDNGVELDKETGFIPGIEFSASRAVGLKQNVLSIKAAYFSGKVDYDGQTQGGTPFQTETDQTLYDIGLRYSWKTNTPSAPERLYLGISLHHWDRDIQGKGNVSGLFETYRWGEAALGLIHPFYTSLAGQIILDAGLLYIVNPEITIDLTPFGYGEPTLDLGSRLGSRFKLIFQSNVNNSLQYSAALYFEAWNFGRSADKTLGSLTNSIIVHEPKSETRNAGIQLTIKKYF